MVSLKSVILVANYIQSMLTQVNKMDLKPQRDNKGLLFVGFVDPKTNIQVIIYNTKSESPIWVDPSDATLYLPLLNKNGDIKSFSTNFKKLMKDYPTIIAHGITHLLDNTKDAVELKDNPSVKEILANEWETKAVMVELMILNFKPSKLYDQGFIDEFMEGTFNKDESIFSANQNSFYRICSKKEYKEMKSTGKLVSGHMGNSRFFTDLYEYALQHIEETNNGNTNSKGNPMEVLVRVTLDNTNGKICTSRKGNICKALFFVKDTLKDINITNIELIKEF